MNALSLPAIVTNKVHVLASAIVVCLALELNCHNCVQPALALALASAAASAGVAAATVPDLDVDDVHEAR